jgi:hypothetical protein
VIASDVNVQITVRIAVHSIARENDGSPNTYLYDSNVGRTGMNDTSRLIIAFESLRERARIFSMGNKHTMITIRHANAMMRSPVFL